MLTNVMHAFNLLLLFCVSYNATAFEKRRARRLSRSFFLYSQYIVDQEFSPEQNKASFALIVPLMHLCRKIAIDSSLF